MGEFVVAEDAGVDFADVADGDIGWCTVDTAADDACAAAGDVK